MGSNGPTLVEGASWIRGPKSRIREPGSEGRDPFSGVSDPESVNQGP